jgi:hypothetical protein
MRDYEVELRNIFSKAIERDFPDEIYHNIARFVGANELDLILHTKLIPMVSLFQGIYLRCVTQRHDSVLCFKDEENSAVPETPPKFRDVYGRKTRIGKFDEVDKRCNHEEFGIDQENDVSLHEMYEVYNKFAKTSNRKTLREIGLGEIQLWLMWRYLTRRSIDINCWKRDFYSMTKTNDVRQRKDEDEEQWGVRVWKIFGGDYIKTSPIRAMGKLSFASRVKACSFTLGCPQNLPAEEAPYANRLSWEREHSRPQSWGGTDEVDLRAMCTFHNGQKGNSWWFDTEQLTVISQAHNFTN